MSDKPVIGVIADSDEFVGRRDAFHAPCILAKADDHINAAEPVVFMYGESERVKSCSQEKSQGIADPFITHGIKPGDTFWVFINPNSVTDLTHYFSVKGLEDTLVNRDDVEPDECAGCY